MNEERIKRIVALAEEAQRNEAKNWDALAIFARLDQAIIGNDKYKRSLSVCLADFLVDRTVRNHLMVVGGSGSGKTYLLEQCLPDFGIPYHMIDASSLVPSGYKGNTLQESLESFFRSNMNASRGAVIVLDEFDKVSDKANGGDIHKSHSIQSELLTLVQGKQEGGIDTRRCLWVFAGAFAYSDEMKRSNPVMTKNDLLKYGFKNELLGRITKLTMTEVPSVEDVVRRVAKDRAIMSFQTDLKKSGKDVSIEDAAFLELAMAAQDPLYGMRIIPTIVANLKEKILFDTQGEVVVTAKMIRESK